jgi:hypothetical protein
LSLSVCFLLLAVCVFAQSDRGTITGTVSDPAGALVPNAAIQGRNVETGVTYEGATSTTGNYTLVQLPAGTYELSVTVPGFKKYNRTGITVQVAQVLRVDIGLEVGSAAESVTVTADAPLLKTESGELSHNVTANAMNSLPILGIGAGGAGASGIRNPNAVARLLPGTYWAPNSNLRVNGAPMNTQSFRIDGQEAMNTGTSGTPAQNQPSVDAIQEMAIQTSNYSAEFGQVGGGYFNITMKGGSNQFHGSGYDYFVNEAIWASTPFTDNGKGGNLRPVQRRNDYGFTIGGPVWIPKIYDGHDRTFFFVNWEQFRETQIITTNNLRVTVPTLAYRDGNFAGAITARAFPNLDPLGNQMREGMIYDPDSTTTVNGLSVRTQFPGNVIPSKRFDPVAVKVLAMVPKPQGPFAGALASNYFSPVPSKRVVTIPSFKIDQNTGSKGKLSFYFQKTSQDSALNIPFGQIDGLPGPITTAIGTFIRSPLYRLNYDYTLTPTMLLHLGAGWRETQFDVPSVTGEGVRTQFDAEAVLGLKGGITHRYFPTMNGLEIAGNGLGGMKNIGSQAGTINYTRSPTFNASLSQVSGNHTFKYGSEFRTEGYPATAISGTEGTYSFNTQPGGATVGTATGQPFQNQPASGGWNVGFPFASFLLGQVSQVQINNPVFPRIGKKQFGLYAQDTWKITRKLTLDYGLRYDYSTYLQEQYGRAPLLSTQNIHPTLGIKGAAIFEGDGPKRCGCVLAHNYPFAFGPRLGMAYQVSSKTVFRAGFGIVYSGTAGSNNSTGGYASSSAITPTSSFATAVTTLSVGIPVSFRPAPWPAYNAAERPTPPALGGPLPPGTGPSLLDQNAGRPARQYQWSVGIQRELNKNLVVEVSYVANRGIWWPAPGLINLNAISQERLALFGLDLNKPADVTLLQGSLTAPAAIARGFGALPYKDYPTTIANSFSQALRPFPQFTTIANYWPPLGKTWYDSLQIKATKRVSHGLSFNSTFTWSRNLAMGAEREVNFGTDPSGPSADVFNRQNSKHLSGFDIPFQFIISAQYQSPRVNVGNKILNYVLSDWTYSALLQYQAGLPFAIPNAQTTPTLNSLVYQSTFANRVAGQPLFSTNWVDNTGKVRTDELDPNCHCYDPQRTLLFNPKAWSNPAPGQFSNSALYYTDYRSQRRPIENMAFGRAFRMGERVTLNIRAEFANVLNRSFWNDPGTGVAGAAAIANAQSLAQKDPASGIYTSGFGFMQPQSSTAINTLPRNGTIVARITF